MKNYQRKDVVVYNFINNSILFIHIHLNVDSTLLQLLSRYFRQLIRKKHIKRYFLTFTCYF